MSNSSCHTVKSLYDLSLNTFCHPVNDDVLKNILEFYPPSIILNVLWKVENIIVDICVKFCFTKINVYFIEFMHK